MKTIKFNLMDEAAKLPTKAHDTDVGFDLYSAVSTVIKPNSVSKIDTGIRISSHNLDAATFCKIEGRSGLASKGIFPVGGIIDNQFRGHIMVILCNHTTDSYRINVGDKIAQLVPYKIESVQVEATKEDPTVTERNDKGFGSSGS